MQQWQSVKIISNIASLFPCFPKSLIWGIAFITTFKGENIYIYIFICVIMSM